jgi:hypothetical protein
MLGNRNEGYGAKTKPIAFAPTWATGIGNSQDVGHIIAPTLAPRLGKGTPTAMQKNQGFQ